MFTLIMFICFIATVYVSCQYIKSDIGPETKITITDKDGGKVIFESDTHTIKSIKL